MRKLRAKTSPTALTAEETSVVLSALSDSETAAAHTQSLYSKITALEQEMRVKDTDLERAKTEAQNLRRNLDDLYGSTSWRLAAPLRLIKDKLKPAPRTPIAPALKLTTTSLHNSNQNQGQFYSQVAAVKVGSGLL